MELDIVAMLAECRKKATNKSRAEVEQLFCEAFIEEIKKVKGVELAPHFTSAVFDADKKKSVVTFEF